MKNENQLGIISIFATLTKNELEEIRSFSVFQNFSANKNIISEDDLTTDMFFIQSGRVAIKSFSNRGYEVLYTELAAGACFGEFAAMDGNPRAANVIALTEVSVARLPAVHFKSFVRRFPALGLALSEYLVSLARDLSERIFELSTMPVRTRVRLEILRLVQETPEGQDHAIILRAPTHHELASRISTHREAVSREIAYLKAQNLIVCSRKCIEIKSIKALRQSIDQSFAK
jgi:CRP/FNR family transcriptional regulator, cyclic AMP receptor protein